MVFVDSISGFWYLSLYNRVRIYKMLQALQRFAGYWTRRHCWGEFCPADQMERSLPLFMQNRSSPESKQIESVSGNAGPQPH